MENHTHVNSKIMLRAEETKAVKCIFRQSERAPGDGKLSQKNIDTPPRISHVTSAKNQPGEGICPVFLRHWKNV